MKQLLFAIVLLFFHSFTFAQVPYGDLENYKREWVALQGNAGPLVGIRSFTAKGSKYYLTVDPLTLETRIVDSKLLKVHSKDSIQVNKSLNGTVYASCFSIVRKTENNLQDAGLNFRLPKESGINLTIDLCPSHKPLDKDIFEDLLSAFKGLDSTLPLAVSVSGKWLLNHPDDLAWLKSLDRKGVKITWINHTYDHVFNKKPLVSNFLLSPGTDLNYEILANEKLMLRNGLVPSVFFRCPGLVSDRAVIEKLLSYGLIAVGSDAWLAKGQQAHNGSIVLIHGNGNEELGVRDFIRLLQTESGAIKRKHWTLYSLSEGLEHYPN
ncbi:polysaccharide deacetylase [Sphingobacterium sp. HMA12]|uniref:polysaccharide deacetylase family protein n=1 Tax=Sphingobacterium sp. HMA12 TaxID=2050894 RepID=UPI000CEA7174|nr:polysaccharide deacetylase [Sphingobacterium sp. HMA12]